MILFLDYDGVLHPSDVYCEQGKPVLRADGELFMWAPILVHVLSPYPDLRIVLSTSWVRLLRFERAKQYLPDALRARVIGATWHSAMGRHPEATHRLEDNWFSNATRYEQIARYVSRSGRNDWLAIDDDDFGWSDSARSRLIATDPGKGLSDPAAQQELREKIKQSCSRSLRAP